MSVKKLTNCKKIGIMGGTFNPIHSAHLLMGRWAQEFAGLDAVLFIPAGCPYMKNNTGILEGKKRLHMVELSIQGQEDFTVSDIEIKRQGNTYTYETLQELHTQYPLAELYFIVGADSLYNLEKWVHPELILKNAVLIAAARNGADLKELTLKASELSEKFGGNIQLMDFPAFDVSSTMLRERIREGKSIRYLTTDAVCDYIKDNQLYL